MNLESGSTTLLKNYILFSNFLKDEQIFDVICSYILVLTGKSETLTKAFIRYGMTAFYLDNLYKEPPWEEMTSVKNVNGFHSAAAKKFRGITVPELQK